jgi:hypothetical protein
MSGLVLGGCTVVYDSQYDDRAGELEEARREVLSVDKDVQLIGSGQDRLFWVDRVRPADENVLHSVKPPNFSDVTDYEWSRGDGDSTILDYHFGEQLVVRCTFGTARAFSATAANTEVGDTGNGAQNCAVDANTVYFLQGGARVDRWVPNGPRPSPEPQLPTAIDFEASGIANSVDGFGVIGSLMVFTEAGGDIYTVSLANCSPGTGTCDPTWLENESQVTGNIFFDDKRVMFQSAFPEGPHIIEYATKKETKFDDAVADGGYHLNFKHGDIQTPEGNGEFVMHGDHVIYRGTRGIFAYGLVDGKVIDILLDRGDVSDPEIKYRRPVVTENGFLYVESEHGFGETGPVYEVDLNARLGTSVRSKPGSRARRLGR